MQPAPWYFDFISPFAYLQWQRLKSLRTRLPIEPRPILFAAVLNHWGQKGPAEIPAKRAFTYRFVHWQAQRAKVPFAFPPAHPFNPIAALRLSVALHNRLDAVDAIFAHIWGQGRAGDSAQALAPVAAKLGVDDVEAATAAPEVKAALRANTDAAIAAGVFGVPTLLLDGQAFWGNDATDMALAYLADPDAFDDAEMRRLDELPQAATRV